MVDSRVVGLLQTALELCAKLVATETDPDNVEALTVAVREIEIAIKLIEQDGPAIPLGE